MVSSNQHDVGTDSSSEHKELSLEERLEKVRRDAYAAGFAEGEVDGFIDGREHKASLLVMTRVLPRGMP